VLFFSYLNHFIGIEINILPALTDYCNGQNARFENSAPLDKQRDQQVYVKSVNP